MSLSVSAQKFKFKFKKYGLLKENREMRAYFVNRPVYKTSNQYYINLFPSAADIDYTPITHDKGKQHWPQMLPRLFF